MCWTPAGTDRRISVHRVARSGRRTRKPPPPGVPISGQQIGQRADRQRGCGPDPGPQHTQRRRPQVAEYQHPVQKDVDHVHQNDRAHINRRQVDRVPVAAKHKIRAHRGQADQPGLEVESALTGDSGILAEERKETGGDKDEPRGQRNPQQQDQQQSAV